MPGASQPEAQDPAAQVAAGWNRNAEQWAAHVQSGRDRIRDLYTFPAFRDLLPAISGQKLIDFGCGEGTNTRRLAELGAEMTGIDLAENMIAHARAAEEAQPLGVNYVVGSYSDEVPFEDGVFDGVVSTMSFIDAPDFAGAMRQACRIVRPGGFVAFNVLHPCFAGRSWRWVQDPATQGPALLVSGYANRASYTQRWKFGTASEPTPFTAPSYPRTMADYLNGMTEAGLRIVRVEEPQPSAEACAALPNLIRWRDEAALLLVAVAERPA